MYTRNFTGELSFVGVSLKVAEVVFSCLDNEISASLTPETDSTLSFIPAAAPAAFCTQQAEIVDPQEKTFFVESAVHTGPTLSFSGFGIEHPQWCIVEEQARLSSLSVHSGPCTAVPVRKKRRYRRYDQFFTGASPGHFQRVLRL